MFCNATLLLGRHVILVTMQHFIGEGANRLVMRPSCWGGHAILVIMRPLAGEGMPVVL